MNRVVIDARWLSTGIGTYTRNVLCRLKSCGDMHLRALTLPRHHASLAPYCDQVDIVNSSIYTMREQVEIPWAARGADLLHVPHYNGPLLYRGTLLVSILDLTHILDETFRRTLKSRLYARPMLQMVSRRADHIFTLSEYSKRTIVEHLNVPEWRVTVTYCGVGPQFAPEDRGVAAERLRAAFAVSSPYILYIGNLKPHKNVPSLLRGFAHLAAKRKLEHQLLIIGDDKAGKLQLIELAQQLRILNKITFISSVPSELLTSAYTAADAWCFLRLRKALDCRSLKPWHVERQSSAPMQPRCRKLPVTPP
jgi:glycosyltransferase involved in cell wall biosynthesis